MAASVGVSVYAAYRPESQIYGATLIAGSDPRQVALTYDDGPNPDATLRLLDILARDFPIAKESGAKGRGKLV